VAGLLKKVVSLVMTDNNELSQLRMPKNRKRPLKKLTERELLQLESEIGAKLFGDAPKDGRREFFCLDEKTWIWHEEWLEEGGKRQQRTIRYEVHEKGILKVQEGARYSFVEGEELQNLMTAATMYYEQVARHVYKRDPQTGQKLAAELV
jgi:hypothetical protein